MFCGGICFVGDCAFNRVLVLSSVALWAWSPFARRRVGRGGVGNCQYAHAFSCWEKGWAYCKCCPRRKVSVSLGRGCPRQILRSAHRASQRISHLLRFRAQHSRNIFVSWQIWKMLSSVGSLSCISLSARQ